MQKLLYTLILTSFISFPAFAKTYDLEIKKQQVVISEKPVEAITINDTIPGPILRFKEGEEAVINVKNSMDETTSIHWHGILLNGAMDGVPGLNGFNGIAPHEIFTYKFKIRQAGTYWYHSHSNLQEQQGAYGSLIIEPKSIIKEHKFDREYVILLSDFTEENPNIVLNNLKIDSGYYNYNKRTVTTFFKDIGKNGFIDTFKDYMSWGKMRMDPTDLADVTNYHFLINGKTSKKNWSGIFKKGERLKLRFINASAMTIYDISIPDLKLNFVEMDGQPIKSVKADEFRIGVAETYDVIVEPKENKSYTIFAESLDRTGYALGSLTSVDCKTNCDVTIPKMRERTLLTMADMAMPDGMEVDHDMSQMDMNDNPKSGWENRGTSIGNKALEYSDISSFYPQKDLREPTREIEFRFGGSMKRYIWTINGEKFPKPLHLKYGERIRLKFINESMMAHPIHLHGMFMQMENSAAKRMRWLPNKHTIIVPPAQTITMLLTADEEGEWAFHCHLLYHMASGMMSSVTVKKDGDK
ncbi:MAG: multicopper oxidase domain-containing protein [Rickettsiales bacterium]|nr:multicopper oxidase domain-containing protein [Rickettsiales bacterium]